MFFLFYFMIQVNNNFIKSLNLSSLTHGRHRERLPPHELSRAHSVQEVTELGVRRETHAAVVQTEKRQKKKRDGSTRPDGSRCDKMRNQADKKNKRKQKNKRIRSHLSGVCLVACKISESVLNSCFIF